MRRKSIYILLFIFILTSVVLLPSPGSTIYYTDGAVKSVFAGDTVTIFYPNGSILYSGEFRDGLAHGYGLYYDEDGILLYEGNWDQGFITGYGYDFYPSGKIKYQGYWKKGHYHGEGTKFNESGQVLYEGDWYYGLPNGQGKLYEDGNLVYSGEFVNGLKHGYGEEYLEGKLHYSGWWFEGSYYLYDSFYLPDGTKLPSALGRYYLEAFKKYGYEKAVAIISPLVKDIDTIEKASDDQYFKYLMYRHLELPERYHQNTVISIIREFEKVPIGIFEDLVALGVKHRFITGSIRNQREFQDTSHSTRGISLNQATGITSTSNKLMVTRLDRGNPVATALHELGHGVDFFLLNHISKDGEFDNLRLKEGPVMFKNPYINTSYFIDYHEEYFAEFFAQIFLPDEMKLFGGARSLEEIKDRAPETYKFFQEHVLNYESKYIKKAPIPDTLVANDLKVDFRIKEITEEQVKVEVLRDCKNCSVYIFSSSSNLEDLKKRFQMDREEIIRLVYKEENLLKSVNYGHTKNYIIYLAIDDNNNYTLGETEKLWPREKYHNKDRDNPLRIEERQRMIFYLVGYLRSLINR